MNTILSRQQSHFSVDKGEVSVDDFKGDQLPAGKNALMSFIGLKHADVEQVPVRSKSPASSEWDVDSTWESTQHETYEIVHGSTSSSSSPSPPSRPYSNPTNEWSPQSDHFRLLIGVMSPQWSSSRRYIIRNAYNQFPQDLPVDVVFVQGDAPPWNDRNADKVIDTQWTEMLWENNTFHDIMHLDCEENLEEGKTYEYFKKVGLEFSERYTHVMKTDDDSFVNIPGIPTTQPILICSTCGSDSRT
jgi:hypothetical protein